MLLIDTYNVLRCEAAELPRQPELSPAALANLITGSRYAARESRLICDGLPPRHLRASLTGFQADSVGSVRPRVRRGPVVLYAGPGVEADDVIERMIETSQNPRGMIVVSSDRRIRAAAKAHRAPSLRSDVFFKQLLADNARRPATGDRPAFAQDLPLEPSAVAIWMREFGIGADSAGLASEPPPLLSPPQSRSPNSNPAPLPPLPAPSSALSHPGPIDPWLLEALEVWSGRLRLDDLDMAQWLDRPIRKHD
jgi:hypothetical protein